jgi:hypothetical protein
MYVCFTELKILIWKPIPYQLLTLTNPHVSLLLQSEGKISIIICMKRKENQNIHHKAFGISVAHVFHESTLD